MTIHCRDFERTWNEKLDARGTWSAEPDRALEAHAAVCPACRAVDARYRALAQAIAALPPLPAVSPGFAERVLAAAEPAPAPARIFRLATRRRLAAVAAAAAVTLAVGLGFWLSRSRTVLETVVRTPVPVVPAVDSDDLGAALADATSATLSLAKEASAPAARVGREVLAVAELPAPAPMLGLPDEVVPVTSVWERVEERVSAGVQPLSGTARSAFGFLLGTPGNQGPHTPSAPPRGA
jgi:hypothetical protein